MDRSVMVDVNITVDRSATVGGTVVEDGAATVLSPWKPQAGLFLFRPPHRDPQTRAQSGGPSPHLPDRNPQPPDACWASQGDPGESRPRSLTLGEDVKGAAIVTPAPSS